MQTQKEPQSLSDESEMQLSQTTVSVQSINLKDSQPPSCVGLKSYGNMIVFCTRPFLITLGPDYLCFLFGYLFFCGLSYLLCSTVYSTFGNGFLFIASCIICTVQCLSYLTVALSSPGIVLAANNPVKEVNQSNKNMICKKCGAYAQRKTYHCRLCDVCVREYDHHCPWTSKCIGKGNIYPFYVFSIGAPIYFLCFIVLMMACLAASANSAAHHKNLKTHL